MHTKKSVSHMYVIHIAVGRRRKKGGSVIIVCAMHACMHGCAAYAHVVCGIRCSPCHWAVDVGEASGLLGAPRWGNALPRAPLGGQLSDAVACGREQLSQGRPLLTARGRGRAVHVLFFLCTREGSKRCLRHGHPVAGHY